MFRVLDAFAGAGGFSLGFSQAGFRIVGGIEVDAWAADTFRANHEEAKTVVADIQDTSDEALAEHFSSVTPNVLIGGPPCQGFSIANNAAHDSKDPRNSMFKDFLRLARIFRPQVVVLENVPNLLNIRTMGRESVIDIILGELKRLDYHVYYRVLEATDFGVPQIRKRLFVVASYRRLERAFPVPTHELPSYGQLKLIGDSLPPCPTLWEAISDLPEIDAGEGGEVMAYDADPKNEYQTQLRRGSPRLHNHAAMNHSRRMIERFASMRWGESQSDVAEHLRPRKRNTNGEVLGSAYDQNNRRMHPNRPCHTIPASFYANFVHPYKNRNFTAREGARIQSFPDSFIFLGKPTVVSHKLLQREGRFSEKYLCQYNQIGNAVPPLVARAIADNLVQQLASLESARSA